MLIYERLVPVMRLQLSGLRLIPTEPKTAVLQVVLLAFLAIGYDALRRRYHLAQDTLTFLDQNVAQVVPQDLDANSTLFNTVANARKAPGILFSNQFALNLTLNWLCNLHAYNETDRIIVIALDEMTYNTLSDVWPQINVFFWGIPAMTERFTIGSGPYQMFQVLRAKVVSYLTRTGTDIWMLQADTFWGTNLFEKFEGGSTDDIFFDREGDDGLARKMIAGGNFYVRANQEAGAFFDEVARKLLKMFATDNNIMGSLCSSEFRGVSCGEIPFTLVANWRWHLGPKTDIPPLLQFDELGGGKFERMKDKLNLKFASEHGYCLPRSRHPKLELQDLKKYPLPKPLTYHLLRICHDIFELVLFLAPQMEQILRTYIIPYCSYFLVI